MGNQRRRYDDDFMELDYLESRRDDMLRQWEKN